MNKIPCIDESYMPDGWKVSEYRKPVCGDTWLTVYVKIDGLFIRNGKYHTTNFTTIDPRLKDYSEELYEGKRWIVTPIEKEVLYPIYLRSNKPSEAVIKCVKFSAKNTITWYYKDNRTDTRNNTYSLESIKSNFDYFEITKEEFDKLTEVYPRYYKQGSNCDKDNALGFILKGKNHFIWHYFRSKRDGDMIQDFEDSNTSYTIERYTSTGMYVETTKEEFEKIVDLNEKNFKKYTKEELVGKRVKFNNIFQVLRRLC